MRVAATNMNLKLRAATQPFNLHVFITLKHTQSSTFKIKTVSIHAQPCIMSLQWFHAPFTRSSKRRAISTCILNTFALPLLDRVNAVSH